MENLKGLRLGVNVRFVLGSLHSNAPMMISAAPNTESRHPSMLKAPVQYDGDRIAFLKAMRAHGTRYNALHVALLNLERRGLVFRRGARKRQTWTLTPSGRAVVVVILHARKPRQPVRWDQVSGLIQNHMNTYAPGEGCQDMHHPEKMG